MSCILLCVVYANRKVFVIIVKAFLKINRLVGLSGRVSTNGLGDQGSISG